MPAGWPITRTDPREVVVTWPDYDESGDGLGADLRAAGLQVRLVPKLGARRPSDMPAIVGAAAGAIVSTDPFDARVLAAAPALRVIARVGVGVDSIDTAEATARGVAVTFTPGANDETVAEHAVALMLAALRRVRENDSSVRRGEWKRTGEHLPWLLTGCTVGLIGLGRTGLLVAERLGGFGVRLLGADPVRPATAAVQMVDLATLLRESDVVSLHVPLLSTTRELMGAAELALMKPTAILVNTARGGLVDETSLAAALADGQLRAAALDVFEDEPPTSSPLLSMTNVTLSPHVAGLSVPSVDEMTRRATTSVIEVLSGRIPADLANPEVLESDAFARNLAVAGHGHG